MNAFEMIANNKNNTNFACHCWTDALYPGRNAKMGCSKLLCERAKIINAGKLSETQNGTKLRRDNENNQQFSLVCHCLSFHFILYFVLLGLLLPPILFHFRIELNFNEPSVSRVKPLIYTVNLVCFSSVIYYTFGTYSFVTS